MAPQSIESQDARPPEAGELTVSTGAGLSVAPDAELATMRQAVETLIARVEALQQRHAMQFVGVHDRLDAVELELPLIQEQSALRMRDLEARMSAEVEETARTAAEEMAARLREDVAGKFGSLTAQIESQNYELSQMRESRRLAESRLNSAIEDVERLCASLGSRSAGLEPGYTMEPVYLESVYTVAEPSTSPFRTRIAEHIRKAAVDAAPDESNPLVGDLAAKREQEKSAEPEVKIEEPAFVAAATTAARTVPGFEDWKRQFMQAGEPLNPTMTPEPAATGKLVVCPRCYSERTRPATQARWDGILRWAGLNPHRCRACGYRFYRRAGAVSEQPPAQGPETARTEEVLESR